MRKTRRIAEGLPHKGDQVETVIFLDFEVMQCPKIISATNTHQQGEAWREKPEPLSVPYDINDSWPKDFMHDKLEDGRSYPLYNAFDDFNGEGLTIDVDFSLPAARVIRSFGQIIGWCGKSWEFEATMDRNTSAYYWIFGLKIMLFNPSLFSQETRRKMPA